jgi:hypothetical protein
MGSFQQVRQYIEDRLSSNWSATDVAFDNIDYTPNASTAFINLIIEDSDSRQITYNANENATHRYEGWVMVFVNVPLKTGTNTARGYADSIADIFRNAQFSPLDIVCTSTQIVRIGEIDGMYQYNVITPFWVDITSDNAS